MISLYAGLAFEFRTLDCGVTQSETERNLMTSDQMITAVLGECKWLAKEVCLSKAPEYQGLELGQGPARWARKSLVKRGQGESLALTMWMPSKG